MAVMDAPLTKVSDDIYTLIGENTEGHYLVGIRPQDFIDEFLPWNVDAPGIYEQQVASAHEKILALQSVPPQAGQNSDHMSSQFIKALDSFVTGTDNGQKLRFARFAKSDVSCGSMNVAVSTYWEQDYSENHGLPKLGTYEGPRDEATLDDLVETPDGVQKKKEEEDQGPACLTAEVETDTERGIHTRGQIAAYAGAAMSMAFRTHFFSMLILGKYARLIRWDRCGAVVTSRFDYTKRPEIIFKFYTRFGRLSPRQRGFDTSVVPLKDSLPAHVAKAFDNYYQESWHNGAKFSHSVNYSKQTPASKMPFYRIEVEDQTLGRTERFFIPAPIFRETYLVPFSRASRRCLAFLDHPEEGKMCFMKDSWQEVSTQITPEADVYRRLHASKVEHIASMRLGGNVASLETETQNWIHDLSHSGRYRRCRSMVCHRIILDTVARDLSTFTWCKVLFSCLADVIEAAQQAYKAGVQHRDISAGNVMIVKDKATQEWRGVLIDWDMCLLLEQPSINSQETCTGRTGTWAFMSARLLRTSPSKPFEHSLGDDMESVFWVLAYEVLQYTRHNREPYNLFKTMKDIFSDATVDKGLVTGGGKKLSAICCCCAGLPTVALADFKMPTLNYTFAMLGKVFNLRYDHEVDVVIPDEYKPPPGPSVEWDNPDDKWLSSFLRKMADKMAPLGVTPTGLESLTQDSKPPTDSRLRVRAEVSKYPADFHQMPWTKDLDDPIIIHRCKFGAVTSSMMDHIEGISCRLNKRGREDNEDSDSEERVPAKKYRPLS
ncbi:hypothetical protein CVT25_009630 [Psilocybe cyanescens]|uniref:Fungal-type protein kinase domain-containing protein n=1 Tax=Psilocybe cyanescens TaxID=93625 RepID=A0A409XGW5_PSICY|nr:hypothetical protein CVT25_009630 [Psilocybe cyanescens]